MNRKPAVAGRHRTGAPFQQMGGAVVDPGGEIETLLVAAG